MSPHLEKFTSATGDSGTNNYNAKNKLDNLKSATTTTQATQATPKTLLDGVANVISDQQIARPLATTTNTTTTTTITGTDGSFDQMLNSIETAFSRSSKSVDVDELWKVLEDYKSNTDEWAKYAYYDMSKYKRNLVAEYDKYNVMIICWGPGSQSCIHDHSGSHCFMKILDGELFESRFAWPGQNQIAGVQSEEMCRLSDTVMQTDDVLYINDKVGLHLVGNPNPKKSAASLHVYIPPYRKCKAFDQRTGRAKQCEINFYSKCGKVVSEDEEAWLK